MIHWTVRFWNTYFNFHYSAALCVGAALFAICIFVRRQQCRRCKERLGAGDIILAAAFSAYMTLLLGVTLLNRNPEKSYRLELQLFWSYQKTLTEANRELGLQILYNILAFLPFGILFPLLFRRMDSALRTIGAACLLSAFIELSQLVFRCGLCELDDIMNNTLGAAAGYVLFRAAGAAFSAVCRRAGKRTGNRNGPAD